MERYEEERFEKTAQRMRDIYKAEEAKKKKKQTQVLREIPYLPPENNKNKRKFPPPSSSSCSSGGKGRKLMKIAKEEFINYRQVMNLKAVKPSKDCCFSSSSSSGSAVASSPIDAPVYISKPTSLPEDQTQNPPAEKKRLVIRIKLPIREKKDQISVAPEVDVKKDEEN